jgi:hypothetical protein
MMEPTLLPFPSPYFDLFMVVFKQILRRIFQGFK